MDVWLRYCLRNTRVTRALDVEGPPFLRGNWRDAVFDFNACSSWLITNDMRIFAVFGEYASIDQLFYRS